MTRPFDSVVLIFNPNSTHDAQRRAEDLRDALAERAPDLRVELTATERAGHGREIARDAAREGRPLVVSVSGDGGYNDVVNGLMEAGANGAGDTAFAAVYPAGNANDHWRVTRERPIVEAIAGGEVTRMDLLRVCVDDGREPRYAHSYVGLGITPVVALELEKGGKGSILEVVSTIRSFARFRPFEIETDTGRERFDSLIFANIAEMAKFAQLSDEGRPDDGRFEVIVLRHTAKWRVLATALRAALRGLGPQPTARSYRFRTVGPMPVQVDGEVADLERGVAVDVEIAPGVLQTVR